MTPAMQANVDSFVDRRGKGAGRAGGRERRQFAGSYHDLSPEGRALGRAIDEYKRSRRRRFINYDELLTILWGLGYARTGAQAGPDAPAG